jgi:hypothetical protein
MVSDFFLYDFEIRCFAKRGILGEAGEQGNSLDRITVVSAVLAEVLKQDC